MTKARAIESLGPPDIKVAGIQIWVHGRQFPDSTDYYDGNWLRLTVHSGGLGASVWTSGAILMVPDLMSWGQQCDSLAIGESQEAKLEPCEPELNVQIRRIDDLGHFAMQVEITPDHMSQEHSFVFEVDQTELREIARQCRLLCGAYPVQGLAPTNPPTSEGNGSLLSKFLLWIKR